MLQYNRARYYDLKNGRWLQRDPTGYRDGANLYESFGNNPTVNTDPDGLARLETDAVGDLVYNKDPGWFGKPGFTWRFARQLSPATPNLMLIDHDAWPYAFLMTRAYATSEFKTWVWQEDYTYHGQFLERAAYLATQEPYKVAAVLDKRAGHAAWIVPGQLVDTSDFQGGNRTLELIQLANGSLRHQIEGAANATAVAFTVTTGMLAAPTGLGGMIVDAGATAADIAGGKVSARQGAVVVTALVAGAALHLRFSQEAVVARSSRSTAAYVFDSASSRYRNVATGRFVAAGDLPWPANQGFVSSARRAVAAGTIIDRDTEPRRAFSPLR